MAGDKIAHQDINLRIVRSEQERAVDILHRLYVIVLPAVNISSAFKGYIVFFVQYQRLGIIHLRF